MSVRLPSRPRLPGLLALPLLLGLALPAFATPASAPAASGSGTEADRTATATKPPSVQKTSPKKTPVKKASAKGSSKRRVAAAAAGAAGAAAVQAAGRPEAASYAGREEVQQFGREVAERHQLDPAWVQEVLAQARHQPSVARLIMPPPVGTPKNWMAYRARFVEPTRIRAGVEFWRQHARWLHLAEQTYGVPAEIVVGIIGVETLYGRHTGNFRVIDALATLAFDFPPGRRDRSAFFRSELEQLLVLARAEGKDLQTLRGSYAGAMGLPQFMPSSWNKYAVDFDADGRADLHRSPADAIGSVAHYLKQFGWQPGMPTHFAATPPADAAARATLLAPDILPSFTPQEFLAHGAVLEEAARGFGARLALIELENGAEPPSHFAGTPNFYAITRYNWSSYYASAVIELGREVRAALGPND